MTLGGMSDLTIPADIDGPNHLNGCPMSRQQAWEEPRYDCTCDQITKDAQELHDELEFESMKGLGE